MSEEAEHKEDIIARASEKMRQQLNSLIDLYKLSPEDTLLLLANLSAGYLYQYNSTLSSKEERNYSTDIFKNNISIMLVHHHLKDIVKMKKKNLN